MWPQRGPDEEERHLPLTPCLCSDTCEKLSSEAGAVFLKSTSRRRKGKKSKKAARAKAQRWDSAWCAGESFTYLRMTGTEWGRWPETGRRVEILVRWGVDPLTPHIHIVFLSDLCAVFLNDFFVPVFQFPIFSSTGVNLLLKSTNYFLNFSYFVFNF